MDGEHGGLGCDAGNGVRRLKLADFFDGEGIALKFDINVLAETLGVDRGRSALVIPDGEVERDEWVARPIEQTNRQPMVARQSHPLPKIRLPQNMLRSLKPEAPEPMPLFTGNFGKRLPLELRNPADAWNQFVRLGIGDTPKKEAVELRRANDVDEVGV